MSKFTPGPWNACHDGECKCGSVFGDGGNVWVAQVYGPHHQSDGIVGPDCVPVREFQIANAKLIQAAPLMHEALEKELEFLRTESIPDWGRIDMIEAALNAAAGGSDGDQ